MTARELIADLHRMGPQELSAYFGYIAQHYYELELASGAPLRRSDAIAAREFWLEAAEAAKAPPVVLGTEVSHGAESRPRPKVTPPPQARWDRTCPECGHEHEGRNECGFYLGEERFCPCEAKVAA